MKKLCSYVLILSILVGCESDRKKVDVSEITIPEITINRLEKDMFSIDTTNINLSIKKLQLKYGSFFNSYIKGILNNGGIRDTMYASKIKPFINDKDMREAYGDCEKEYANIDKLKKDITETFKYIKHYFPTTRLPKVVTMMSGFNYSMVTLDSTLAIGLEMYLGRNNKFYSMLTLPKYRTNYMNKENIMPDVVRNWAINEFPYHMNKNDFLSQIIYMGKIIYLTETLLPSVPDTTIYQYTNKQMEYCFQNEFNMWQYFIAQKTIYTTDQAVIMKFTSDGPFTTAFSKEAPPRVGYWIGTRIVKQFMKNNPEETLQQLMKEKDAQLFLDKAKYKPRK